MHGSKGGARTEDGPAQEVAGTLPQDFTLSNMRAEYKGEDKTVERNLQSDTMYDNPLFTAGKSFFREDTQNEADAGFRTTWR